MRGKPELADSARAAVGITPAGAGKTSYPSISRGYTKDHPRRCGENRFQNALQLWIRGSPPQVRGKRLRASNTAGHTRITPAGAGKTVQPYQPVGGFWDHPRRCGENFASIIRGTPFAGSPPQVRGKPSVSPHFVLVYRITPAGAGKTFSTSAMLPSSKDHPRRCGENAKQRERIQGDLGSPPQVRGKLT